MPHWNTNTHFLWKLHSSHHISRLNPMSTHIWEVQDRSQMYVWTNYRQTWNLDDHLGWVSRSSCVRKMRDWSLKHKRTWITFLMWVGSINCRKMTHVSYGAKVCNWRFGGKYFVWDFEFFQLPVRPEMPPEWLSHTSTSGKNSELKQQWQWKIYAKTLHRVFFCFFGFFLNSKMVHSTSLAMDYIIHYMLLGGKYNAHLIPSMSTLQMSLFWYPYSHLLLYTPQDYCLE